MSELLDEDRSAEPKRGLWSRVLELDDDTELTMTITDLDGSNPQEGVIRVGDVRAQMARPEYQALMRGAYEHLQEMREQGELPLPDTIPDDLQA